MTRLAMMECKIEDSKMVEIFFKLFNEALAKYLGDDNYKFNPMMLCMDKAGANLQGVHSVYGDKFMA